MVARSTRRDGTVPLSQGGPGAWCRRIEAQTVTPTSSDVGVRGDAGASAVWCRRHRTRCSDLRRRCRARRCAGGRAAAPGRPIESLPLPSSGDSGSDRAGRRHRHVSVAVRSAQVGTDGTERALGTDNRLLHGQCRSRAEVTLKRRRNDRMLETFQLYLVMIEQ